MPAQLRSEQIIERELVIQIFESFPWLRPDGYWPDFWHVLGDEFVIDYYWYATDDKIKIFKKNKNIKISVLSNSELIRVSIEEFMECANPDIQIDLLFHLDLFVR